MSLMTRASSADSADLARVLERSERLAGLAERSDLVERLGVARSWLAGRTLRVAVTGSPGDADAALGALRRVSPNWLPGASFVDAPGLAGYGGRSLPAGSADVVLFVTDAGREYGRVELDAMHRIRSQRLPVLGVLAGFDARSNWGDVQRVNRQRLQEAGLDSPSVPLLPVSAALCEYAWVRQDEGSVIASGVPQVLEVLRDRVGTPVDGSLRDAVFSEGRIVAEQLAPGWNDELTRLRSSSDESPAQRQQQAVAELERRQQLSTSWQIALNDGVTEMGAQMDFHLRERLREVLEFTDEQFREGEPFRDWNAFDSAVRDRIEQAAQADHQKMNEHATGLAREIAGTMTGTTDGSSGGVALPRFALQPSSETVDKISSMNQPEGGGSMTSRVVNSVRGSYGGILMVGVMTSLAGEKLISVYSVGAGLLLGAFTFWEDRKNTRERHRGEAKVTAAKTLDEANFRVGDHQRAQLRTVHRTLRDHFTTINDARLKEAADAVRAASEGGGDTARRQERATELESHLAELRELRDLRTSAPAAPVAQNGVGRRRRSAVHAGA